MSVKYNSIVIQIPKDMVLTKKNKKGKEKDVVAPAFTKKGSLTTRRGKKSVQLIPSNTLKIKSRGVQASKQDTPKITDHFLKMRKKKK